MRRNRGSFFRGAFLSLLLALVCIGAAELAVCSREDPVLYHRLVDPVFSLVLRVRRCAADWTAAAAYTTRVAWADFSLDLEERAEKRAEARRLREEEERLALEAEEAALAAAAAAAEEALRPKRQPPDAPSAPVKLAFRGETEVLLGGAYPVVYFNQTDPVWADRLYGRDPLCTYGCGPTTMAMAVSTLTDRQTDPAEMAVQAVQAGYWAPGSGSYHSIVPGLAGKYGLTSAALSPSDSEGLRAALSAGELVVGLMGKGHFTESGHFILLCGLTEDGRVLVSDSNSRLNTLTPWAMSTIQREAQRLWRVMP